LANTVNKTVEVIL